MRLEHLLSGELPGGRKAKGRTLVRSAINLIYSQVIEKEATGFELQAAGPVVSSLPEDLQREADLSKKRRACSSGG